MAENRYYPQGIDKVSASVTVTQDNTGDFNGNTDDVIIQAINSLPNTGGTVLIKKGTYTINNTITLKDYVRLIGEGISTTILKLGSGANKDIIAGGSAIFAEITTLKIDGNVLQNSSGNGLALAYNKWCRFDNLWVGSCAEDGIDCVPNGANVFENNIISRCEIMGNGSHGLHITAKDSHIINSYIHNNTLNGIHMEPATGGWVVVGNHFYINNVGIRMDGSGTNIENNTFLGNYIELNQYDGIHASDEIKNNIFMANLLWNNSQNTNNTSHGIKIDNPNSGWCANNVFTGNKIWENHGSSLSITTDGAAPANTITGNDFEDNINIRAKDIEVGNSGQATNLRVQPYKSNGTSNPTSTPDAVGDIFVNTTTGSVFISVATSTSADWNILN